MPCNIIAIDDEPEYLNLLSEFAAISSISTVTFSQWSDEVLPQLNQDSLLFLDINMPKKDGIDSLMLISNAGFQGQIILLSGADESVINSVSKLGDSLNLNMFGTLTKPFTLQNFQDTITRYNNIKQTPEVLNEALIELDLDLDHIKDGLKHHWIYPVYQPQINPETLEIEGMECLTRFKHPKLGFIPPQNFINALTDQNLIEAYTLLFMDKAINEIAPLLKQHQGLSISFNVSALSLNRSFTSAILDMFSKHDITPSQITIEITETSAISLSDEALYAVSKFRAQGFNLSVDDFGTGYSTFLQLNDLPFTELKVDKTFVDQITTSNKSYKIVKASIVLAEILSLKSVAEGIETKEQLAILKAFGCNLIQGYLYSKPLEIEDLKNFIIEFNH